MKNVKAQIAIGVVCLVSGFFVTLQLKSVRKTEVSSYPSQVRLEQTQELLRMEKEKNEVLYKQGHYSDDRHLLALYVSCDLHAHLLFVDLSSHAAFDNGQDLLKAVVAESGKDLGGSIKSKVSERRALEKVSEIYGDKHLNGLSSFHNRLLLVLHLLQGHHHNGAKEIR